MRCDLGKRGGGLGATYIVNKKGVSKKDLPSPGVSEMLILKKALKFVTDNSAAIDGGANSGTWSIELAKYFDKVFAFEPHAGAFFNLAKNVKHIDSIQPIEQALGNVVKNIGLHTRRKVEFTDAYVDLEGDGTQMVPLDYYELKNVGLIKLDLEGFEYFALLGMEETLRHCKPVIVIESIPKFDKRFGLRPREDLEFLESVGYKQIAKIPPNRLFIKE